MSRRIGTPRRVDDSSGRGQPADGAHLAREQRHLRLDVVLVDRAARQRGALLDLDVEVDQLDRRLPPLVDDERRGDVDDGAGLDVARGRVAREVADVDRDVLAGLHLALLAALDRRERRGDGLAVALLLEVYLSGRTIRVMWY